MNNNLLSYLSLGIGLLILTLVAVLVFSPQPSVQLGGTTNFDQLDTTDGYSVDGTSVINGSGVFIGAISGTTGAFSGRTTLNTLIEGGTVTTLTAGATSSQILTAAQICDSTVIQWAHGAAGNLDVTFPATTTLYADCLTANGTSKTLIFRNTAALSGTTTTMVAGSGMVLLEPDGQNVVINGGNAALVTLHRITANVITAIIDEVIDAD